MYDEVFAEVELYAAQRRVILEQAEVLEALGFELEDIAACSEPETSAPPISRGRFVFWLCVTWLSPGPFWAYDHQDMLHHFMRLVD